MWYNGIPRAKPEEFQYTAQSVQPIYTLEGNTDDKPWPEMGSTFNSPPPQDTPYGA